MEEAEWQISGVCKQHVVTFLLSGNYILHFIKKKSLSFTFKKNPQPSMNSAKAGIPTRMLHLSLS